MSANKFRYYEVTSTRLVKALNKTTAAAIASGRRNAPGEVLGESEWVDRLSANEAHEWSESTAV